MRPAHRWTAPEVIRDSRMDKAADVYSFAIIMWELLTWQQPYKDMMSIQVMYNAVMQHQRPSVPALDDLPGNPGGADRSSRSAVITC